MESCKKPDSDYKPVDHADKSSSHICDKYGSTQMLAVERQGYGSGQHFSSAGCSRYGTSNKWKPNISSPTSSVASNNLLTNPSGRIPHLDNRSLGMPFYLDSHSCCSSSCHSKSSVQAPYVSSGIQPVEYSRRNAHLLRMSPSSILGQGPDFRKYNLAKDQPNSSTGRSYDGFRMRESVEADGHYPKLPKDQTCGPRSNRINTCSAENNDFGFLIQRDQYNRLGFRTNYEQAKFFMIKSFSEEDVHKSIKYSVWSSTSNGNRKLDDAYRESLITSKEKATRCPIFLFFSVNASGQFVGLCEMVGPVDFNKTMDFWQESRWTGFFPVTWHIIKDIPNRHFRSITLENNENKAVTFSRDTQEIGLPHGLKMLQIFKSYPHLTSILDDFGFYEGKERMGSVSTLRSSGTGVDGRCRDNSSPDEDKFEAAFMKLGLAEGSSARAAPALTTPAFSAGSPVRNNPVGGSSRRPTRV